MFYRFYSKKVGHINYLFYLCSARGATVVVRLRGRLVLRLSLYGVAVFCYTVFYNAYFVSMCFVSTFSKIVIC